MSVDKRKVEVADVGFSGWGNNLARNYKEIPEANLRYVCDLDQSKLDVAKLQFMTANATTKLDDLMADEELKMFVVATDATSHFEFSKHALLAGKDVYVENPFVFTPADALELFIQLASQKQRILMFGHLLENHPVVQKLKSMIDLGVLGKIDHIYSQRLDLGCVYCNENALWNFAPHDISVILYLPGAAPAELSGRGRAYLKNGIEDMVVMTRNLDDQAMGCVRVSWLDPHKIRRKTISGSKRMALFDDMESTEKLDIYDEGAELNTDYDSFAEYVGLRFGDITLQHIRVRKPLRTECDRFTQCVRTRTTPLSDSLDESSVVQVLEAASILFSNNDSSIKLTDIPL